MTAHGAMCGDLDVTSTSFMLSSSSGDGTTSGTMRLRPVQLTKLECGGRQLQAGDAGHHRQRARWRGACDAQSPIPSRRLFRQTLVMSVSKH